MPTATAARPGTINLQGIQVPATAINPQAFMALTRRMVFMNKSFAFGGLGSQSDYVEIPKVGVLGAVSIEFSGTLTVTLNGGTVATTGRWPYDLLSRVQFTANGMSNLINVSGWHLKAREIMQRGDLSDKGVTRGITGASPGTQVSDGSLSLHNESWGVGQGVTAIAGAPTNYSVDLSWRLPVAYDDVYLTGAVHAQTSSTDLAVTLNYATPTDLFALTGSATVALTGTFSIIPETYSIPAGPDGVILPDLSHLHSLVQSQTSSVQLGENETRLAGQGVGRQTMRMWTRLMNGAAGATRLPVAVTTANFGPLGWRYGANDTPQLWPNGRSLAVHNERVFGNNMARQGFAIFDFVNENAFRDTVDQGAATELRLVTNVQNTVTLTNPSLEYVQELLLPGAAPAAA